MSAEPNGKNRIVHDVGYLCLFLDRLDGCIVKSNPGSPYPANWYHDLLLLCIIYPLFPDYREFRCFLATSWHEKGRRTRNWTGNWLYWTLGRTLDLGHRLFSRLDMTLYNPISPIPLRTRAIAIAITAASANHGNRHSRVVTLWVAARGSCFCFCFCCQQRQNCLSKTWIYEGHHKGQWVAMKPEELN